VYEYVYGTENPSGAAGHVDPFGYAGIGSVWIVAVRLRV
jgi:hypothetical protein